jgi:4-amino-4-deoxy-L-arabinose transferase-like glycosyltransferase
MRGRGPLILTIVTAVALRAALIGAAWLSGGSSAPFLLPDSTRYLRLARSFIETGAFSYAGAPELVRPPGFPVLVAIGVWLTHPVAVTLIANALLGAATTWLCFLAARDSGGGDRAALRAARLFAVEPGQIVWSSFVLSEALFTCLVAVCLVAGIRYATRPTLGLLVGAVLAAVLGAYVRVVGYLLPIVWLAALVGVVWRGRRGPWRGHVIAGVTVAIVLLGAWHVRNGLVGGYWGFSTQFDRAVYLTGGGSVLAGDSGTSYGETRAAMLDSVKTDVPGTSQRDAAATMREQGRDLVVRAPFRFARTYAAGMVAVLLHPSVSPYIQLFGGLRSDAPDSATRLVLLGHWAEAWRLLAGRGVVYWSIALGLFVVNLIYLALAIRGAIAGWHAGQKPAVVLCAIVVAYFLLLSGGPDGDSRRRMPMVPAVCVLAVLGVRRDES